MSRESTVYCSNGPVKMTPETDKANILVVDDLPEKHLVYRAVLDELGENVVSVSSGAEALKQVLHHPFAVILLDVNMPGMDGFETARLIRGHRRASATPIIFLTAFADEVRTAEGYATGAVDYLPTPVVPEILRAKVRVFVELYKMRRQMAQRAEEKARHAAAEEANHRLTFLADAGAVLGRSLDFETTSRDLVRFCIPFLADMCVLSFPALPGSSRPHLIARRNSIGDVTVSEEVNLDSLLPGLQQSIERALDCGQQVTWPEQNILSPAPATLAISFPLEAREHTLAVLTIAREGERSLNSQDLKMAAALASRGATALDNAFLHEELRKADRQKIDFLSMLAHELRNPLAPIHNSLQILKSPQINAEMLKQTRDVMERQLRHLVRLVDDLLDVSRVIRGKVELRKEPVALATVIDRAVEIAQPLIDEQNHQLEISLPPEPLLLDADPVRLTQVISNLLANSAKYMEENGHVWLTARRENEYAVLKIRDTGIGIAPDMLAHVFELFVQADHSSTKSQGGLGIGLTLVKNLVEMHEGHVLVQSAGLGQGSEFTVRLPLAVLSEIASETPGEETNSSVPSAGHRVLVVDDNRDAAITLSMVLRLQGHQVQVAHDGPTALEMTTEFQPDMIFLDIGMPGMDGYEVARRIRMSPDLQQPILAALTGWGQQEDRQRTAEAGFDHHLVKPPEPQAIEKLLASLPCRA